MSRLVVVAVILLLAACAVAGILRGRTLQGVVEFTVTSDTTGDSTIASGWVELKDGEIGDYRSMMARVVVSGPYGGTTGMGNADSAIIGLYSVWGTDTVLVAVDTNASFPVTIRKMLPYAAGNDTILKDKFLFKYNLWDTCSDTVADHVYKINYDIRLEAN
jgi:hypothetical protein